MSSGLVRPGGDPGLLEQMAAQLDTAARGAGNLADSTREVTAGVRSAAEWTGDASDAYLAFTGNLTYGVTGTPAPLARIATAMRGYAGSLRVAQQKAAAYADAVQVAQASGNHADAVAADAAGQDAAVSVAAQQVAGDQAAAQVRKASGELEDLFGPNGLVRTWTERVHAPWDSLAGDAVLGHYLAVAADGQENVHLAGEFADDMPELMSGKFAELTGPLMAGLSSGEVTETQLAGALRGFTADYEAIGGWNQAMKAAGEAASAGSGLLKGVAAGSDALAIVGDVYTEIEPEDTGVLGGVDRGAAAVNAVAAGVDGTYAVAALVAGTTAEVPVVGEVALVGTGLYLGADYLYHHWTPFRDVANDIGHTAASAAKDAWHDVTGIF